MRRIVRPLAVLVSAANVPDSKMMLATVDASETIRAKTRGRPRRRPHKLHDDKGYDYRHLRLARRKRRPPDAALGARVIPRIARRGVEPKNRLGRYRWVVERTLSWLNCSRRLKIRYTCLLAYTRQQRTDGVEREVTPALALRCKCDQSTARPPHRSRAWDQRTLHLLRCERLLGTVPPSLSGRTVQSVPRHLSAITGTR
jgi:hypothetical protein